MIEGVEEEYGEIISQRFECGCYFKGNTSTLCREHLEGRKQPRDIDGKYNYGGNWERKCACGHRLGKHLANKPRLCNECECEDFKRLKANA